MKKHDIAKALLYTIAAVGLVAVAVTIPNIAGVIGKYSRTRKFTKRQLQNSLYYLKQNHLISWTEEQGRTVIRLTKNGKEKLLRYKLEDLTINRPKRWDKKWRLIIFDIPEKLRINRTYFAAKLKSVGFIALQKSVWVFPYPCEDEIDFLKEIFEIRKFVRIVTAVNIDIQNDLIERFKLT